jgi:hypothetical protein
MSKLCTLCWQLPRLLSYLPPDPSCKGESHTCTPLPHHPPRSGLCGLPAIDDECLTS